MEDDEDEADDFGDDAGEESGFGRVGVADLRCVWCAGECTLSSWTIPSEWYSSVSADVDATAAARSGSSEESSVKTDCSDVTLRTRLIARKYFGRDR